MSADTEQLKPCPVCKQTTLKAHCAQVATGSRCGWWKCINRVCDGVFDFRLKRGHVNQVGSPIRRKVTFLPGGEVA